jgi:hypothetical protein
MRPYAKSFLTAAVLLISVGVWAQEAYHADAPDLLARLSYDHSAIVHGEDVRQVCIAVSRDGEYRIMRSLTTGEMQRLRGTMTKEQIEELKKLLGSADFRALSGAHGGLIRQEAESFGAEIPAATQSPGGIPLESAIPRAHRLQWLNPDGESPFPAPVAKLVDWLKHFEPENAKAFDYAEYPDVCPSGGLRLIQPSVAENGRP